MKIKSVLAAGLLMSAFAAIDAHADNLCSLTINPSSYVPLGQAFSYGIEIGAFSPLPPDPRYTVVFFGTKDGVADIPPGGEPYPGVFGLGHSDLTGFVNPPSGGFTGFYLRYAVMYDPAGHVYCTTNLVAVALQ